MRSLRDAHLAAWTSVSLAQCFRKPHKTRHDIRPCLHRRPRQAHGRPLIGLFFGFGLSAPYFDVLATSASAESGTRKDLQGNLAGIWIRDQTASDMEGYSRMLELLHLSGLQRTTAMQLIEGLEVEQTEDKATVRFLTVVPFFKVTEELDFTREVQQGRRDLRQGHQVARCKKLPKGLYVEMSWGEPMPGRLTETYHVDGSTLYVESCIEVQDGKATSVVVYRRSEKWKPRFSFPF